MDSFIPGTPFEAADYGAWARLLFRALPRHPAANLLFNSTMAEPADLLHASKPVQISRFK